MTDSANFTKHPTNAMTVDVEDYFQVSAFDPFVDRSTWGDYAGRVEANTDRILALFDQYNVCLLYTSPSPRDRG